MQITFNPRDPREVADMFNTLRLLGMIDAAVNVTIEGGPQLMTHREAKELKAMARPELEALISL